MTLPIPPVPPTPEQVDNALVQLDGSDYVPRKLGLDSLDRSELRYNVRDRLRVLLRETRVLVFVDGNAFTLDRDDAAALGTTLLVVASELDYRAYVEAQLVERGGEP